MQFKSPCRANAVCISWTRRKICIVSTRFQSVGKDYLIGDHGTRFVPPVVRSREAPLRPTTVHWCQEVQATVLHTGIYRCCNLKRKGHTGALCSEILSCTVSHRSLAGSISGVHPNEENGLKRVGIFPYYLKSSHVTPVIIPNSQSLTQKFLFNLISWFHTLKSRENLRPL